MTVRAPDARRTCGERIIALLEQHEVSTVFGIPGVHTLELYRGLVGSQIRHVTPRHEQGAAFAADGWARMSGRPGVCILISGPGLTNALTAVAQAYHDSQPMLVISTVVSTQELGRACGGLHDLPDQRRLMTEVTAFSHTVRDPRELPGALARAWEIFDGGRPRPVHIEVPVDVLGLPTGELERLWVTPTRPRAARRAIDAAVDVLASARSPMIVLGGGAVGAGAEAMRLAEAIDAPVALTINGKAAVADDHPLCLGATLSFEPTVSRLETADAIVVVGAQLSREEFWALDRPPAITGRVVRIDVDPEQIHRPLEAAVGLVGDACATLRELADACGPGRETAPPPPPRDVRWPPRFDPLRAVLAALDRALPRDRVVIGDSAQLVYAANHMLPVHRERSWMAPVGYGTLGCALPMSIGAKLAAPERPVVCMAGDGGFLFTIQELATAVDLELALPVVLWNNHGYGEIRDSMDAIGIPHVGTSASAADFVAIAEGFGCAARRVTALEALDGLVASALREPRPTLLELTPDLVS